MATEAGEDPRVRQLRRRLWAERTVFAALLALLLAYHFGKLGGKSVCVIAVDGHPVAVVASRGEAERLIEEIKSSSGLPGSVTFSHQVHLYAAPAAGHHPLPYAEALALLTPKLEPVVEASVILVNGEPMVGLPSRSEALQTISSLLRELSPPVPGVQAAFKESIRVETLQVPATRFAASAREAVEKVLKASAPKGEHEVRPGETGWKIALDGHVALSRLAQANPGVDLNAIRAGDRLKIPGELPPLTVVGRKEIKEELGPGTSTTVRVTYENGVEVSRDVIGRQRPAVPSRLTRRTHRRPPAGNKGAL